MSVLISCILPVHNNKNALVDNFGNLVYQTIYEKYGEDALEIILVDDASSDDTASAVDDLCAQFPGRVIGYHLPEHMSFGGSCNFGFDEAQGQYVSFMNVSDMVDVAFYERIYEKATEGEYYYDYVDSPIYNEANEKIVIATPADFAGMLDPDKRNALLTDTGLIYSRIFRRSFLKEKGIRLRDHTVEGDSDEDFMAEVICFAYAVNILPNPMYVRKKSPKKKEAFYVNNFVKRFSGFISSVIAVYGRLMSFPDYELVRLGAETFYLRKLSLAIRLFEKHLAAGEIQEPFDTQLAQTIRTAAETVLRTPLNENPYAMQALGAASRERLGRYVQ